MNTLNGYSKSTLTDKYVLTAAGGHLAVGNTANNIPLSNGTVNTNLNADLLDGEHGSRYTLTLGGPNYITITVEGDAATYYPVIIKSVSYKYPMLFVNISREYSDTAPDSWNTSTHKGGLTLTLLWNGSRYWDGNSSGEACYCVYVSEIYCTMVGGLGNSTAGKVVWLRGGGAVYHIHAMNGTSVTANVYTSTYTDSAELSFAPRTTVKSYSVRWPGYSHGADKLVTTKTIWGLSFDGTQNVTGNMTGVGTINTSGNITTGNSTTTSSLSHTVENNNGKIGIYAATRRGLYDYTKGNWLIGTDGTNTRLMVGNVGIGTDSPSYKLHVAGTASTNLLFVGGLSHPMIIGNGSLLSLGAANSNSKASVVLDLNTDAFRRNSASTAISLGTATYPWINVYGTNYYGSTLIITNTGLGPLEIKRNIDNGNPAIKYSNKSETLGYIGLSGSDNSNKGLAYRWNSDYSHMYKIFDSGNSSVTGGGSNWGSSITINLGGTSKTLTIPSKPSYSWTDISDKPVYSWSGSSPLDIILANYETMATKLFISAYLAHGSGSIAMGYKISGYESTPYGGWFGATYSSPWFIGASAGTWTLLNIITDTNYTSYTVKKDGTGASGTWGINITGNAATATLASTVTVGSGSSDIYRAIVVHNGNSLYSAEDKVLYNYSTGDVKATSFTGKLNGSLVGGAKGNIIYQSAANTTAFLTNPSTNGYVLKFNTSTGLPYWASDSNTTYSAMSLNEANTGTETISRVITASVLHTKILNQIIASIGYQSNSGIEESGNYISGGGKDVVTTLFELDEAIKENRYTLPLAASGTRGGILIGYSGSGKNYAVKLSSEKAYVSVPWTDTKVNVTLATTTKAYLLGVSTTPTSTALALTTVSDTGVYLDTTAGSLTATNFKGHLIGTISGSYTSNGGQQNPNYFGKNKVGFLMMNTSVNSNSNYKDWMIMDCYTGSDVGGAVAFGVNRQSLGAYIMRSTSERTSWTESAELLGTHNYDKYVLPLTGGTLTGKLTLTNLGVGYNIVGNKPTGATYDPWSIHMDNYLWIQAATSDGTNVKGKIALSGKGAEALTELFLKADLTKIHDTILFNKLSAPTTSGGSTYGPGVNGQVLKSNGSTVYWANDNNSTNYLPLSGGTISGDLAINLLLTVDYGITVNNDGTDTYNGGCAIIANGHTQLNGNLIVTGSVKLGTSSIGSSKKPIYLNLGTLTACTYAIDVVSTLPTSPDNNTIYFVI